MVTVGGELTKDEQPRPNYCTAEQSMPSQNTIEKMRFLRGVGVQKF